MKLIPKTIYTTTLIILGMVATSSTYANPSALPVNPQAQTPATQSVQTKVDSKAGELVAEKRKKLGTPQHSPELRDLTFNSYA